MCKICENGRWLWKGKKILKNKRKDFSRENADSNRDNEAEINTGIAELKEGKLSAIQRIKKER